MHKTKKELHKQYEENQKNENELIDISSEDSFPGSDPPAWTTGRNHKAAEENFEEEEE